MRRIAHCSSLTGSFQTETLRQELQCPFRVGRFYYRHLERRLNGFDLDRLASEEGCRHNTGALTAAA